MLIFLMISVCSMLCDAQDSGSFRISTSSLFLSCGKTVQNGPTWVENSTGIDTVWTFFQTSPFSPFITLACNNSAGGHYLLGNFDYATSNCLSESVPLCPVSYQIAPSAQNSWTYNATTKMLFTNSELSSNGSAMCLTSATYQLHTPCAKNPLDACETFATTCSGIGTLPITLTPVAE